MIRKPIVTILGHVDHGKTQLLDTIRHTTVLEREAGAITQAIGASIIPMDTIMRICGEQLKRMDVTLTIPGLLFIDTPGHEAFSNLRRRGGNLADIAILVVDMNEGFKPQSIEAVEIMKKYKTPFLVAANKIDLVNGWKKGCAVETAVEGILQRINRQDVSVIASVENKLYNIVGKLHELGFESERFDRVDDYTKQIAIVPISAKTGEGVNELLVILCGLTQKYLQGLLKCDVSGHAQGTILEVKEEKGLGKTIDVIIYDGTIKVNDTIVIAGIEKQIITKVRALLEPKPLAEMRDAKTRFSAVKEVHAASGVKIAAPELEHAIAGMPLRVVYKNDDLKKIERELQMEVEDVLIETDKTGIVAKADALGSLEALLILLRQKNIPIRKATIGNITKKDIVDAETNIAEEPLFAVVLGFNVGFCEDALAYSNESEAKAITGKVIYQLIDDYEKWQSGKKKEIEIRGLEKLTRGCKFQLLPNHTFRQSNPAIVGVDIVAGMLKTGAPVMKKDGTLITTVKSMKSEKEHLQTAKAGTQLAVAMDGVMVGRQIKEGDMLYAAVPEDDFRKLKEFKEYLSNNEKEVLKEIALIMRKKNPVWGI